MAERKVTVRLAAEGGPQVRAELEGVGRTAAEVGAKVAAGARQGAEGSEVLLRVLHREEDAFQRLKASVDPAYAATLRFQKLQEATARAVRLGVASQEEANQVLALAKAQMGHAGEAAQTMARGFDFRGPAMQLSQVAQQSMATGDVVQALAIQLPDMALGFGTVGIAAGVAAGVLLPLAADFLMTGDAVEDMTEHVEALSASMDRLSQARQAAQTLLPDLVGTYGAGAEQARELLEVEEALARLRAERQLGRTTRAVAAAFGDFGGLSATDLELEAAEVVRLREAIAATEDEIKTLGSTIEGEASGDVATLRNTVSDLRAELGELGDTAGIIADLEDRFGFTAEEAARVAVAVAELGEAQGVEAQTQAAEALRLALTETGANLRDADDATLDLVDSLFEAEGAGLAFAAINFASGIWNAVGAADALGSSLQAAADLQSRLNAQEAYTVPGGRGEDPRRFLPGGDLSADVYMHEAGYVPVSELPGVAPEAPGRPRRRPMDLGVPDPDRGSRRGGGSSGGGASPAEKDAERQAEAVQKIIDRLREEQDLLRETDPFQQEMIRLREQLTGATASQRTEIEDLVRSNHAEAEALELIEERQEAVRDLGRDMLGGVISDLREGASAGEAFANVLDKIADRLIDMSLDSLFGSGPSFNPLATLFGGASGESGGSYGIKIPDAIMGALSGARASGGSVWSGGAFLVGENGPEVFTPNQSGWIVPNHRLAAPQPAAGGGTTVVVNDMRSASAPPVETSERRGPDGRRMMQITLRDEVRRQFRNGEHDGVMRDSFGTSRRLTQR